MRAKHKNKKEAEFVSANVRIAGIHSRSTTSNRPTTPPNRSRIWRKTAQKRELLCVVSVVRAIESGLHNMRAVCVYSHQRGLDRERVYTRQYKHEHILVLLQSNM